MAGLAAILVALLALGVNGSGSALESPLSVNKRCSPEGQVGQPIIYIIEITNSSGSETLSIDSVSDPLLGGELKSRFPAQVPPGSMVSSGSILRFVQESDPRPLINTVVVDVTGSETGAHAGQDSCSVDVPHLTVTKNAEFVDDTTVYTFGILNDGNKPVFRAFVQDSVLGDLSDLFPQELAVGESAEIVVERAGRECNNTVTVVYESHPRAVRVDASAVCDTGGRVDVAVAKECLPKTGLVGDPINVRVEVTNTGGEPLTNISVLDDHAGALAFDSGDNGNGVLDPGETWLFVGSYNPNVAGSFTNQAEVSVTAPDGTVIKRLTNTETCVRDEPENGSQLTPTDTECGDFRDDTATDQDALLYGVRRGNINQANPGVFFYFTHVSIASTAGTADEVSIDQSITALREIEIKDVSVYYDPSCQVQSRPRCNNGATDCVFEIEEIGDFIIRVRYNSQSLKGFDVCPGLPMSTHTFATSVGGVQTTQDSLDVMPKPGQSC